MNIVHHFLPSKYILTFVQKIKTCQLVIWPAWLQISLRKWLSSGTKVTFWGPFCLCKLDGQELKIPLGNRVFRIQHTQIRLKTLVPNFYSKMPLELYRALFFRKSSRLYLPFGIIMEFPFIIKTDVISSNPSEEIMTCSRQL